MSYCVNCGVELDKSAKKCALCNTPVYNPNEKPEKNTPTPFSHIPDIPKETKPRFIALIITFIILIPNNVCILANIFFSPENLWFVYIAATSLLCWILFVFPFLTTKRLRPYFMWGFDTIAVALYILVLYTKDMSDLTVFFEIVVPIIAIISACILYFIYWYRQRKRHWTSKMLHVFIDLVICLSIATICFFINSYIECAQITLIADACCLALVFFLLYANKSKRVRAWMARKIFI